MKTVFLKLGSTLHARCGVHTGYVITGVLGETKPQFQLFGRTVDNVMLTCSNSKPGRVCVTESTMGYLELYTNNLEFTKLHIDTKDSSQIK